MKQKVSRLVFIDILFILLLSFSGSAEGALSDTLYYAAFIIPIAIGLFFSRENEPPHFSYVSLKCDQKSALISLLLSAPTISLIMLCAYLTSLVLGLFGIEDKTVIEESLPLAVLLHALLPAVLEEGLFRLVPLEVLRGESKRAIILISALCFSLVHANLYQLPYAFIAGVIFAVIDIAAGSILPSLILHFLNNLISLLTMLYPDSSAFVFISIGALAVISVILIIILRKRLEIKKLAHELTCGGDSNIKGENPTDRFPWSLLALIILSLFIAISNILI